LINDRLSGQVWRAAPGQGVRFLMTDADAKPLHPQRAEFTIALALRLAREATSLHLVPIEVTFAHAAPADSTEHRDFFRSPVRFSSGLTALVLSDADGARTLRAADPPLAAVIRKHLDKALAALDRPDGSAAATASTAIPLAARVRRLLIDRMGHEQPSIKAIGHEIGMSARTLSRRLAAEDTSFREIQDEVRHHMALALLSDPNVSIAEVAFFLGYAEPAPFHRSFKRWTGKTPQEHRRTASAVL